MEAKPLNLSDLVKFNEKNEVVLVNWRKFVRMLRLSRKEAENNEETYRRMGYYIFMLKKGGIITHDLYEAYVISKRGSRKKFGITYDGIEYGFIDETSAREFAQAAYPEKYDNLKIAKFEPAIPTRDDPSW